MPSVDRPQDSDTASHHNGAGFHDEARPYLEKRTPRRGSTCRLLLAGPVVSYVLMMVGRIVLRRREPGMHRQYGTPGGIATTSFALVVAVIAVAAMFSVDPTAALWTLAAFLACFGLYSRHHLVANSSDEEFAASAKAEEEPE